MLIFLRVLLFSAVLCSGAALFAECAPLVRLDDLEVSGACWIHPAVGDVCRAREALTFTVRPIYGQRAPGTAECEDELIWRFGSGEEVRTPVGHTFQHRVPVAGTVGVRIKSKEGSTFSTFPARMIWGTSTATVLTEVKEADGVARVLFHRDSAIDRALSVTYSLDSSPHGAYLTSRKIIVSFPAGLGTVEQQIPITNDAVFHQDGAIVVYLDEENDYVSHGDFHRFPVTDDDKPAPSLPYRFALPERPMRENDVRLELGIIREQTAGAATARVELSMPLSPGGVTSQDVTFASGASRATFMAPIEDDTFFADDRAFTATVYDPANPGERHEIALAIHEDEAFPRLAQQVLEVRERDEPYEFPVELTIAPMFRDGGSGVHAANITTSSNDYSLPSPQQSPWAPQSATKTINVTIAGDDLPEIDEEVELRLGAGSSSVTIRILDDDRPPYAITFASSSYALIEGAATVTLVRSGAIDRPVTATLRVTSERSEEWIADQEISFAIGETSKQVVIAPDDPWFSGERQALLTLESEGFTSGRALAIVSDDEPMPRLSVADSDGDEGGAVEFTLALSGPAGRDLAYHAKTAHGTAGRDDYTAVDTVVTIPRGATFAKVSVPSRADSLAEADEAFTLSIDDCCPAFVQLARGTATGRILERSSGDKPLRLDVNALSFNEQERWLEAGVTRRANVGSPATVVVKLISDKARVFTPVTIPFAPNERRRTVRFPIDDAIYSGNAGALLEVFDGATRIDFRDITIVEDEPLPVVTVQDSTSYLGVNGGELVFPITIDPPSMHPLQIVVEYRPPAWWGGPLTEKTVDIAPLTTRTAVRIAWHRHTPMVDGTLWELQVRHSLPSLSRLTLARPAAYSRMRTETATGARVLEHDDRIPGGTTRAVTIMISRPVDGAKPIRLVSTHPDVLSVPATVPLPLGATSVTIEVTALKNGTASIEVDLPPAPAPMKLLLPFTAIAGAAPVVSTAPIVLRAGEWLELPLGASRATGAITATLTLLDPAIAVTDRVVRIPANGSSSFQIYGATAGRTELMISFPDAGGMSVRVPVVVLEAAARDRAVRH